MVDNAAIEEGQAGRRLPSPPSSLGADQDLVGHVKKTRAHLCVRAHRPQVRGPLRSGSATSILCRCLVRNIVDGISLSFLAGLRPGSLIVTGMSATTRSWRWMWIFYPTGYRVLAGHRLRVQVSGGAFPRFSAELRHAGTIRRGRPRRSADAGFEIYHDSLHPSRVVLPVLHHSRPASGVSPLLADVAGAGRRTAQAWRAVGQGAHPLQALSLTGVLPLLVRSRAVNPELDSPQSRHRPGGPAPWRRSAVLREVDDIDAGAGIDGADATETPEAVIGKDRPVLVPARLCTRAGPPWFRSRAEPPAVIGAGNWCAGAARIRAHATEDEAPPPEGRSARVAGVASVAVTVTSLIASARLPCPRSGPLCCRSTAR